MAREFANGPAPARRADAGGPAAGVLVVDDQKVFREVMRAVVEATPGFALVGEASCGADALAAIDELDPELVIVDVRMPGMDGLELTHALLARAPAPVVVLVSAQSPPASLPIAANGRPVVFVAKERLCPAVLVEVWEERRPAGPARALGAERGDPAAAEDAADADAQTG